MVAEIFIELPLEVRWLCLAKLARNKKAFMAFCLSCKEHAALLKNKGFWRAAITASGRQVKNEDAESLKKLISQFYNRIYQEDVVQGWSPESKLIMVPGLEKLGPMLSEEARVQVPLFSKIIQMAAILLREGWTRLVKNS